MTEETRIVEESAAADVAAVAEAVTEKVAEVVSDAVPGVGGDVDSAEFSSGGSGDRKVVRLSVGQEVKGVIKRVTEFGAFVDIGAGRDGLYPFTREVEGVALQWLFVSDTDTVSPLRPRPDVYWW